MIGEEATGRDVAADEIAEGSETACRDKETIDEERFSMFRVMPCLLGDDGDDDKCAFNRLSKVGVGVTGGVPAVVCMCRGSEPLRFVDEGVVGADESPEDDSNGVTPRSVGSLLMGFLFERGLAFIAATLSIALPLFVEIAKSC